jgi:septal ring factor EnvC (AmiA/AmiB activator)
MSKTLEKFLEIIAMWGVAAISVTGFSKGIAEIFKGRMKNSKNLEQALKDITELKSEIANLKTENANQERKILSLENDFKDTFKDFIKIYFKPQN